MPRLVQTVRGPNAGTGMVVRPAIGAQDRSVVAQPNDTSSERTPSSRILPSVIGGRPEIVVVCPYGLGRPAGRRTTLAVEFDAAPN
jgi:hypothetical protein